MHDTACRARIPDGGAISQMAEQWSWNSSGVASRTLSGACYDEKAFRYFLSIERRRAARANRSFLLLKVSIGQRAGGPADIGSGIAVRLWPVLWDCVRDIDFLGWFRDGRVAGAVLSLGPGCSTDAAIARVRDRVVESLHQRLPADVDGLNVRVLVVRPRSAR